MRVALCRSQHALIDHPVCAQSIRIVLNARCFQTCDRCFPAISFLLAISNGSTWNAVRLRQTLKNIVEKTRHIIRIHTTALNALRVERNDAEQFVVAFGGSLKVLSDVHHHFEQLPLMMSFIRGDSRSTDDRGCKCDEFFQLRLSSFAEMKCG